MTRAKGSLAELTAFEQDEQAIRRTRRRLLKWGRANYQDYAWRSEPDPWLTFAAEFLLQRTRAAQVEPVFRDLCARHPTAASLCVGGTAAVESLTSRLGLRWRGPLLLAIAEQVAEMGGQPPESLPELQKMTGVGMYTSAAWLSLHRGKRAAIIDSNVARWLSRMTSRPYNKDPRGIRWIQQLADALTPRRVFRDYNYAVLDFTMKMCVVRTPRCPVCPLKNDCHHHLTKPRT